MQRRQMTDTLKQRQGAVDEAVAGKYGTLLNHLQSSIRSGFSTAGTIHDENPLAVWGYDSELEDRKDKSKSKGKKKSSWDLWWESLLG